MKKIILITGMSGTGKSTISKRLRELGYTAHDIENIPNMFTVTDTRSNQVLTEWDTNNLEQIKNLFFGCNIEKLSKLIKEEVSDLSFYCGTATNIEEIVPLFDKVILLQASPNTIRHRLSTRITHDFARKPEMQDWIIELKSTFENSLIQRGAITVNADGDIEGTIDKLLRSIK